MMSYSTRAGSMRVSQTLLHASSKAAKLRYASLYRKEQLRLGAITIESETPAERSWIFHVRIDNAGAGDLTLSWADSERWSGGRVAPAQVAKTLIQTLLDAGVSPSDILDIPAVDAARLQRRYPFLDDAMLHAFGSEEPAP